MVRFRVLGLHFAIGREAPGELERAALGEVLSMASDAAFSSMKNDLRRNQRPLEQWNEVKQAQLEVGMWEWYLDSGGCVSRALVMLGLDPLTDEEAGMCGVQRVIDRRLMVDG